MKKIIQITLITVSFVMIFVCPTSYIQDPTPWTVGLRAGDVGIALLLGVSLWILHSLRHTTVGSAVWKVVCMFGLVLLATLGINFVKKELKDWFSHK